MEMTVMEKEVFMSIMYTNIISLCYASENNIFYINYTLIKNINNKKI